MNQAHTGQGETRVRISPKLPLGLAHPGPYLVTCEEGMVWITAGDGNDYMLKSGESLRLRPRDKVIMTAMFAPAIVRHARQREPARAKRDFMVALFSQEPARGEANA